MAQSQFQVMTINWKTKPPLSSGNNLWNAFQMCHSVLTWNQAVNPTYISLLRNIYSGTTVTLKLHQDSKKNKLERGAIQGDNVSPRLLTACLQNAVLNKIKWENHGINIDREHLAHLAFADDIIMMAHTSQELEKMLNDIHTTSQPVN